MTAQEAEPAWRWLESTVALQSEAYGFDYDKLRDPGETVVLSAHQYYNTWNALAAMIELAEMTIEFKWKPWAVADPVFVNTARLLEEAVDVGHFIANLLTGAGVTDEQYVAAYKAKQDKNRRRAASGSYSSRKGGLGEGSETE